MPYLEVNTNQLPTTQEYLTATTKPALEKQITKSLDSSNKFANYGQYDFSAYRKTKTPVPDIELKSKLEVKDEQILSQNKEKSDSLKPKVQKQNKFTKFLSLFRGSRQNETVEKQEYISLNLKNPKVFGNGIELSFSRNATAKEKTDLMSQFVETINHELNLDINFEGSVNADKGSVYFYSRYHQTKDEVTELSDQPIVVDLVTQNKIKAKLKEIFRGI